MDKRLKEYGFWLLKSVVSSVRNMEFGCLAARALS
jgi:hypothetical protein